MGVHKISSTRENLLTILLFEESKASKPTIMKMFLLAFVLPLASAYYGSSDYPPPPPPPTTTCPENTPPECDIETQMVCSGGTFPTQVALSLIFALTCLTLGQRIMMEIPVPCLALSCAIMLTMKCGVPVDPTMDVTLQVTVCQEAKMKMAAGLVVQ